MRWLSPAVVLLVGATAWAQQAPDPPAESGTDDAQPSEAPPPRSPAVDAKADTRGRATPPVADEPAVAVPDRPVTSSSDIKIQPEITRPLTMDRPGQLGFRFGSYGRAIAGTDLRGGKPQKLLIVARGPRVVEQSYLELDFSHGFETARGTLRPVVTLAFAGLLFHETGQFDAQPALRNLFLEGSVAKNLYAWAGSRMYRGDDIYLFDTWPLDDLNTLGAGLIYNGAPLEVGVHAGINRLQHPFQFQEVDVANPVQGATLVEQLNRQRIIASATASYIARDIAQHISAKVKLHAEIHTLPSGTRKREDGTFESLPSDRGTLIGVQLGTFGFAAPETKFRRHMNLFLRYAKGLAAFDELAPPTSFGPTLKTTRASEVQLGVSAAWDHEYGNVIVGALSRRFVDADTTSTDPDDGWEYAIGARPLVRLVPDFFAGADVSYQARFPRGLNPITLRAEDPALMQIAPMIVFSPMGPSAYDRPQLRLVYRAARLNEGARNLYVPEDPRHDREWVHFLGAQAEWWFNSSTYR